MRKLLNINVIIFCIFLVSCKTNPVTGENEMSLISTLQELKLGEENYLALQQSEGGKYNLDPELNRYVQQVGQKLAKVSDRKLPYEFVIINSSVPNAWALPGGKIGINRGLLLQLGSEAELAAVLGHEIVHAAARHSAKKMETEIALNIGLVVLGASQSDKNNSSTIMAGGMLGATLLSQSYSRDSESEADEYGIKYMVRAGYDPYAAVELQQTFVRLSNNKKVDWVNGLFASHPPSQKRVKENRKLAEHYANQNLYRGEMTYKFKMERSLKIKAAYDKYDKASKAIENKQWKIAESLLNVAIKIEDREGLFYALKGDIRARQQQHNAAIKLYSYAIHLNSEFFYFYLQRGLNYKATNNREKAKNDLTKSMELLPTKEAKQALQEFR